MQRYASFCVYVGRGALIMHQNDNFNEQKCCKTMGHTIHVFPKFYGFLDNYTGERTRRICFAFRSFPKQFFTGNESILREPDEAYILDVRDQLFISVQKI